MKLQLRLPVVLLTLCYLWPNALAVSAGSGAPLRQVFNFPDADGDQVTVQLTGSGTMTVSLVNPSNGPIDQITLSNTDTSSSLTINVKKSRKSAGLVNVNAISGNGSLKGLNAKSVIIVGSGINLGGSVGMLAIAGLKNSGITLSGSGVSSGALVLASFSAAVVTNSQILISGSVGKASASQMIDSQFLAGYTASIRTNPMAGGSFVSGNRILSVSVKGVKGATAFGNSIIAAQSIGSATLVNVNTNNGGVAFGILSDSGIKSVSVKQPKFKWNPKGRITQRLNDFEVRRMAEVIIASHTRILKAADLSDLVISNNIYAFSTNSPSLQGVQAGDVLVSGVGNGFLVQVLSVTTQGGSITLQTGAATVTNALQEGAFDETLLFHPRTLLYAAPGVSVITNSEEILRITEGLRSSLPRKEVQVQLPQLAFRFSTNAVLFRANGVDVRLNGTAGLTITPEISAQVGLFSGVQEFSATINADLMAGLDFSIDGGISTQAQVLVAQYQGDPYLFFVGAVPVVVVPTLQLYAGVQAEVEASVDFEANADATYTAGAEWQKNVGWNPISNNSIQFSAGLANATIAGNVRGYLRPEITLDIDDVAGPDIYGEAGLTLAAQLDAIEKQFCWSLTGDLDAGVGLNIDLLGDELGSYQQQLFTVSHQFAGKCYSVPTATTDPASAITSNSATLNSTVNPNGLATTVHFEWGTTTSYGRSTTSLSVGSGSSGTNVSSYLTGLNPNTIYHFRLVASNIAGLDDGTDKTFTTGSGSGGSGLAPTVTTAAASAITSNSATMNGSVNPNGVATMFHFEWETSSSYVHSTTPQSAGGGTSSTSVNSNLSGLSPNTIYHFRLVGSNNAGTVGGADETFTTTSGPSGGGFDPTVSTGAATGVTSNSATLNGTVDPNGLTTTAYFEWGATTAYGNSIGSQSLGSGSSEVAVTASLTALNQNASYHFRLVASNSAGITNGTDQSFTTSSLVPPCVVVTVNSPTVCSNTLPATLTATVTGSAASPFTFSWTGPGGFTSNTQSISVSVAGAYNVTVTDTNGCTGSGSGNLTANECTGTGGAVQSNFFTGTIPLNGDISSFFDASGNALPGVCVKADSAPPIPGQPGTAGLGKSPVGVEGSQTHQYHPSAFNQRRMMSAYNPTLNGGTIFVGIDLAGGTGSIANPDYLDPLTCGGNPPCPNSTTPPIQRGSILPFDADGNGEPQSIGRQVDGTIILKRCADRTSSNAIVDIFTCDDPAGAQAATDDPSDSTKDPGALESYTVSLIFTNGLVITAEFYEDNTTPSGQAALQMTTTPYDNNASNFTFGVMASKSTPGMGPGTPLGFDVEFAITNVNANVDPCTATHQILSVTSGSNRDGAAQGEDNNVIVCQYVLPTTISCNLLFYTNSTQVVTNKCGDQAPIGVSVGDVVQVKAVVTAPTNNAQNVSSYTINIPGCDPVTINTPLTPGTSVTTTLCNITCTMPGVQGIVANVDGIGAVTSNCVPIQTTCESSFECCGVPSVLLVKKIACELPQVDCSALTYTTNVATCVKGNSGNPAFCYSITITNIGTIELVNIVVQDDVLGNLTSFYPSTLPVGGSATAYFSASYPTNTMNTAMVDADGAFSTGHFNSSDNAEAIVIPGSISCTTFVTSPDDQDGVPNDNNVSIPSDGKLHVVNFSATIQAGNADLTNVVVELVPINCTTNISFMAANSLTNISLCTLTDSCDVASSILTNTALVGGTVITPNGTVAIDTNRVPITVNSTCLSTIKCLPCPTCQISGPSPVAASSSNLPYSVFLSIPGSSVNWSLGGNGTIIGPTNGLSIVVSADDAGSFTVSTTISTNGCTNICSEVITVTP